VSLEGVVWNPRVIVPPRSQPRPALLLSSATFWKPGTKEMLIRFGG
jgi:hypothetical protein